MLPFWVNVYEQYQEVRLWLLEEHSQLPNPAVVQRQKTKSN
jgi:hypothetical protein